MQNADIEKEGVFAATERLKEVEELLVLEIKKKDTEKNDELIEALLEERDNLSKVVGSSMDKFGKDVEVSKYRQPLVKEKMSIVHLYFKFDGRIGRFTYFVKGLLVLFALTFLVALLAEGSTSDALAAAVLFLLFISCFWMNLAINVKRAHDLDHSGWWLLWSLIPLVSFIIFLILLTGEGSDEPNQFGEVTY